MTEGNHLYPSATSEYVGNNSPSPITVVGWCWYILAMPKDVARLTQVLGTDSSRWPNSRLIELPPEVDPWSASNLLLEALQTATKDSTKAGRKLREFPDDMLKRWFIDVAQHVGKWRYTQRPQSAENTRTLKWHRKAPTRQELLQLFTRDRYHCRYCGMRVVGDRKQFIKLAQTVNYPELVRTGTNEMRHGLYLTFRASHDHVLPISKGGTNDMENLVTACWPCQFGKAQYTLSQLGMHPAPNPVVHGDNIWPEAVSILT
jgi:5-methylcytosine-specific restriction endonuclease McrA